MPKNWDDSIYKENLKILKEYSRFRSAWDKDAVRFDNFRYGQHFSQSEEADIIALRQAPLPINITAAICDTADALTLASEVVIRTAPVIFPYDDNRTNQSKKVAALYSSLLQQSWYQSLGQLHYDRAIRDYSNVGRGLLYAIPKNEYGEFKVDIKHVPWYYYYPDPACKSPLYDDADNHCIYMDISEKAAFRMIKSHEPDITEEDFKDNFVKNVGIVVPHTQSSFRYYSASSIRRSKSVPFIQTLELEEQEVYRVFPNIVNMRQSTGMEGLHYKTYMKNEIPIEFLAMAEQGKLTIIPEKKFYLTEHTSIGSKGYDIIYPIEMPNIVPIVYDHRDTPYPMGRVWYLYPLQRALNKFIMIAILNGSLLNVTRVMAEENSIVDMNEWKMSASVPNTILRYRLPMPTSKPPQVIEAKPLPEAWLAMPQYLTQMMEYISGIFSTMMGSPQDAPTVFSTVASLQSAGGQKIKRRLQNITAALSQLGKVVASFYQHYAPPGGMLTYVNNEGNSDFINYNELVQDGSKVSINPESDLSIGIKDVRFIVSSSSGYEAATEAAMMTTLATQLRVPQLVPLILKRLNIPDVDKIVDQMDSLQQASSVIEQQKDTIDQLNLKTRQMANQIEQNMYKISKTKFDANFAKLLSDLKANYGIDLEKQKSKFREQLLKETNE